MRRLIQVFKPSSLALHWKGPIKEEDLFKWLFEYMFTYKSYKWLISPYETSFKSDENRHILSAHLNKKEMNASKLFNKAD